MKTAHNPAIEDDALRGELVRVPAGSVTKRYAVMVAKILGGANPAERPTNIQLNVNLKASKALGITIPQSVLLRADEVIE